MKHKKDEVLPRLFCVLFMRLRLMNPRVQGLRFAPVGAEPTSTGCRAPHLPRLRLMNFFDYSFCDVAKELYMDEQQMQDNDIRLKDAYRRSEGLLTSTEISAIRGKYGISQNDLCVLLGWGGKTIIRYESHQVQDKAHDTILKKINKEQAYIRTAQRDVIQFKYAETLQI